MPPTVSDIGAKHELTEAFIEGAGQLGVPRTDDVNAARHECAGYFQRNTHNGAPCSTAKQYLTPAVNGRPDLRIETEAFAARLVLQVHGAVSVRYRQKALMRTARATGGAALGRRRPGAAVVGYRATMAARRARHALGA